MAERPSVEAELSRLVDTAHPESGLEECEGQLQRTKLKAVALLCGVPTLACFLYLASSSFPGARHARPSIGSDVLRLWSPEEAACNGRASAWRMSPARSREVVQGPYRLAVRGGTSFRIRRVDSPYDFETPMVDPDSIDSDFQECHCGQQQGIVADFGAVTVTASGQLMLYDSAWKLLTSSMSYGTGGESLALSTAGGPLYGSGASSEAASEQITLDGNARVASYTANKKTFVPFYYSAKDGYAALGAVNRTHFDKVAHLLVSYFLEEDEKKIAWNFEGPWEMYLMPAASLRDGIKAYYSLIGGPRVLPRYAYGFMISRWGWPSREEVESAIQRFRAERYPIDAVILDFEWFTTQNDYAFDPSGEAWYKDFGWNSKLFPEPAKQLATYRNEYNIRIGVIRKPRIGNSWSLKYLKEQANWILRPPENVGRFAHYLNGRSLNFSTSEVRDWYSEKLEDYLRKGISFWWNDEGESDYFTSYWWNAAEMQATRSVDPTRRFFSLARSWSPGMARQGGAVWTGDVFATWKALQMTPGAMLNWILAGAPYVGCDVGGFWKPTTGELLTRWLQVAAFMPLMRIHSANNVPPHFPWLFGDASSKMKAAIELRYRLLPYHYSLAHRMYTERELWIRPLAVDYPEDADAATDTSKWLDGNILVAPVLTSKPLLHQVRLPEGLWFPFESVGSSAVEKGPRTLTTKTSSGEVPAFVKAGTIVPLAPVVQSTEALPGGALEVQVYAGQDAYFELIEDDGESVDYESGKKRTTYFNWGDRDKALTWAVEGLQHARHSFAELSVTYFGIDGSVLKCEKRTIGTSGVLQIKPPSEAQEIAFKRYADRNAYVGAGAWSLNQREIETADAAACAAECTGACDCVTYSHETRKCYLRKSCDPAGWDHAHNFEVRQKVWPDSCTEVTIMG